MSLIMMESCDLPSVAGAKWDLFTAVTFAQTVDSRTCWKIADNRDEGLRKNFAAQEDDTIILGFRHYKTGLSTTNAVGSLCGFYGDGGTVTHITVEAPNSDGSIDVRRAGTTILATSSAGALSTTGAWQYIEVKVVIHDTTGSVIVNVDGVEVVNVSGVDTRNGGTDALIDRITIGSQNTADNSATAVRDIVLMNGQGSSLNDFLGPVIVEARLADGAGDNTDWTANTGTNFAAVDDPGADDGDTTYVESTAAADRDDYTFADLSAITTAPIAVQAHAIARYNATPLDIATYLRRSATNDDGTAETPTGSYASRALTIWETDPIAAAAWTLANFNATNFGIVSS